MEILILNGSPKGKNSVTLQTCLYLKNRFENHKYTILDVGLKIKKYEKDFSEPLLLLNKADLIIFAYPIYTFLAPYQLHRFIELMKENNINLKDKYATQISTSKHFYDVTAHKYIELNCYDFKMRYIKGLSADMDDLLTEKGQNDAKCFFNKLIFDIEKQIYKKAEDKKIGEKTIYKNTLKGNEITGNKDVLILTNMSDEDENLNNMIEDFIFTSINPVRVINIRKFPFKGGCISCFNCATDGKCIYNDGFDDFLRNKIQSADAIVYAFSIKNHYTHSSFKCYDDRQFCNGHRSVTTGMPVGYIISGDYSKEDNIQTLVEARSEVGGVYLCGVATDEQDVARSIKNLSLSLEYALSNKMYKPSNFYGVGGTKIFRDLVYLMQGLMKADHKFYKTHGIYDFPQKQKKRVLQMKFIGLLLSIPSVQKKTKGKMNKYILEPYKKIIEDKNK